MRDINSLNRVILIGRLGGNPELRYLPQSERAVAKFTLATNERYYNPNTSESDMRTEWHRIIAWGKLAEFCEKYLSQGRQICLEGKLRTRNWQDKDGNKRTTTEIEAQTIVFLGRREEAEEEQTSTEQEPASPPDLPADDTITPEKEGEDEEEVPF